MGLCRSKNCGCLEVFDTFNQNIQFTKLETFEFSSSYLKMMSCYLRKKPQKHLMGDLIRLLGIKHN